MVDTGNAIALCGNHEHNAICFNFKTKNGFLREHSIKNFKQHSETLLQFHGNQKLYNEAIEWFKTLPLYYKDENFNAVHATYDSISIDYLQLHTKNGVLSEEQYHLLADNNSQLFKAVEITCKGMEIKLSNDQYFLDKDGTKRVHIRTKWWLDPTKNSLHNLSIIPGLSINSNESLESTNYYKEDGKPVFFGHYWLKGRPILFRDNICCTDFSVAKDGFLCAYRFNGEKILSNENFIYV